MTTSYAADTRRRRRRLKLLLVRLSSRAPEMGEAEITVGLDDFDGDEIEIGFNPQFILDALKVVDIDRVIFEMKAPNKPGTLKADTDFTYVVMPVNLQ